MYKIEHGCPLLVISCYNGRDHNFTQSDCFILIFVVEQRKQPDLRGLPTAVVQYNSWKGGALIAVSYEARKYGVKR